MHDDPLQSAWYLASLEGLHVPAINMELFHQKLKSVLFSDRADARLMAYFEEARYIRVRKAHDYGPTWVALGARGVWTDLFKKVLRLRQLLWKGKTAKVNDESIRDTLLDMLNYTGYNLHTCDDGNVDGILYDEDTK